MKADTKQGIRKQTCELLTIISLTEVSYLKSDKKILDYLFGDKVPHLKNDCKIVVRSVENNFPVTRQRRSKVFMNILTIFLRSLFGQMSYLK
jgi:hypothetical protein